MNSVDSLNRQPDEHLLFGVFWRQPDAQLQFPATVGQMYEHLVNSVLVHAGSRSHFVTDFATMTAQKTYGARTSLMTRLGGEDAQQTLVIIRRPLEGIILSLVAVMRSEE